MRAGDDDDAVKFSRNPCLIEKRYIHQQPSAGAPSLCCFRRPAGADDGMKDGLQCLTSRDIRKDNLSQFTTIRPTSVIQRLSAKRRRDGIPHRFIPREQFMHATI